MDNMIKETNDNLKAIIDNLKSNKEDYISALDNIQNQMDKKVEEAKKYKVQVDSSKDIIRNLEEDNKSLEASLSELNDKYGKMNLVSVIEAGNKEIKSKINDNLTSINKEKEHIADLTNKARTIKDLLIDLKKDKTVKEEKLANINVIYDYYNERVNEICDYASNNDLSNYKPSISNDYDYSDIETSSFRDSDLENTMVFDEIANIDDTDSFKDEMSFITDQIEDNIEDENKYNDIISNVTDDVKEDTTGDSTEVFNTIFNVDESVNDEEEKSEEVTSDNISTNQEEENTETLDLSDDSNPIEETIPENVEEKKEEVVEIFNEEDNNKIENTDSENFDTINTNLETTEELNLDNDDRINKINDLFSSLDDINTNTEVTTGVPISDIKPENVEDNTLVENNTAVENNPVENTINKIDDAYMDIFGKDINEQTINEGTNNKDATITDIFGNPIENNEISNIVKNEKQIDLLFSENKIDFNKFKETEQNYLKQIYNEEKFSKILEVLNKYNINLNNLYHAFNIFGEMTPEELDQLIGKFINVGQSTESIGFILEKLPKVKKYDLDSAINSFGEYVKDVDITELVIKAKELFDGGNK